MNRRERRLQNSKQKSANKAEFYGNRGIELAGKGKTDQAISAFRKAISIEPKYTNAHYCLGTLLSGQGLLDDAVTSFRAALALQPDHFDSLYNMANALQAQGHPEQAEAVYRTAIAVNPGHAAAISNLGNSLKDQGRFDEAATTYRQAITAEPGSANAHYNLGVLQMKQGQLSDAIATFNKALTLAPGNPAILSNLGLAYRESDQTDDAISCYRKALETDPNFAEAHNNLGNALLDTDQLPDAVSSFRQAISLEPEYVGAYVNLSTALQHLEQFEEAEAACRRALELDPENADAHFGLALILLKTGNLAEGWREYEWRWRSGAFKATPRIYAQPRWDGSDLNGKTIALWGEQGIGDELRHASLIPDLAGSGANIVVECDPRLVSLYARSFPDAQIHGRDKDLSVSYADKCDFQLSIIDLAKYFRSSVESFPPRPYAYLKPAPDRVEFWRGRLDELGPRPKVGILWRGLLDTDDQLAHYASVEDLAPILGVQGVDFVNLMYGECSEDRARIADLYGVDVHTWDDINLKDDQDDLAALIANLDLVISPSTATAFLAAALDVSVLHFVRTRHIPEFMGDPKAPGWAPSMTNMVKNPDQPWDRVMNDLADEMRKRFDLS